MGPSDLKEPKVKASPPCYSTSRFNPNRDAQSAFASKGVTPVKLSKLEALEKEHQKKLSDQERKFAAERTNFNCQIMELKSQLQAFTCRDAETIKKRVEAAHDSIFEHQTKVVDQLGNLESVISRLEEDGSDKGYGDSAQFVELIDQLKKCQQALTKECEMHTQQLKAVDRDAEIERISMENLTLKETTQELQSSFKISNMNLYDEHAVCENLQKNAAEKDKSIKKLRRDSNTQKAWIRSLEKEVSCQKEHSSSHNSPERAPVKVEPGVSIDALETENQVLSDELGTAKFSIAIFSGQLQAENSLRKEFERRFGSRDLSSIRSEVKAQMDNMVNNLRIQAISAKRNSDYGTAIDYIAQAIGIKSTDTEHFMELVECWNDLASIYNELESPERELHCYNKAVEIYPSAVTLYKRAVVYCKLGEFQCALDDLKVVLEHVPTDRRALDLVRDVKSKLRGSPFNS